jgi:hypothetical protein
MGVPLCVGVGRGVAPYCGLQKVSAQLELSKAAPQTVLNNQ